ncbi:hypothetical protein HDU92_007776 [Lobulomyces angularis]|nr:hypothetical protein HDU92_007776 [Lobulomyces angularis]
MGQCTSRNKEKTTATTTTSPKVTNNPTQIESEREKRLNAINDRERNNWQNRKGGSSSVQNKSKQ